MKKGRYTITEKMWIYPGETANWHFVTLTKSIGQEIKELYGKHVRGFGSLPVSVTIGETTWKTSIFPDKISKSYILPIKAIVRKKEELEAGEKVTMKIELV